jgi:hypothetical protein
VELFEMSKISLSADSINIIKAVVSQIKLDEFYFKNDFKEIFYRLLKKKY